MASIPDLNFHRAVSELPAADLQELEWVVLKRASAQQLTKNDLAVKDLDSLTMDGNPFPSLDKGMPVIAVIEEVQEFAVVISCPNERLRAEVTQSLGSPSPPPETQNDGPYAPLTTKSLLVVGAGCLGSLLTRALISWGFRKFMILDREVLEDDNLLQHELDDSWVGMAKAEALAASVTNRFPFVSATGIKTDVLRKASVLRSINDNFDLLIVAVDNRETRIFLNHLAVTSNVPAIFLAMYKRATIAEAFRFVPGGPCLNCAELALNKDLTKTSGMTPSQYRPGVFGDVLPAVSVAARMTAEIFVSSADLVRAPAELAYISVTAQEDLREPWKFALPFETKWVSLLTDTSCHVCQIDRSIPLTEALTKVSESFESTSSDG